MWGVIGSAVVCAAAEVYNTRRSNQAQDNYKPIKWAPIDTLAQDIAEHKRIMAAEHKKTIQQTNGLCLALLALVVVIVVGTLQLFGVL